MSLKCKLGWHDWIPINHFYGIKRPKNKSTHEAWLEMYKNKEKYIVSEVTLECKRCGKTKKIRVNEKPKKRRKK